MKIQLFLGRTSFLDMKVNIENSETQHILSGFYYMYIFIIIYGISPYILCIFCSLMRKYPLRNTLAKTKLKL